jgi:hypothetical protein
MRQNIFSENSLTAVLYLPCSPALAPSDVCLFSQIKTSLIGPAFNDANKLLEADIEI